jgi:vacuolar-type H+-ATPase subunit H
MIERHLESIRSREEEAESKLQAAKIRGEEVIERARIEGEKLIEEVRAEATERERTLLAQARESAGEQVTALRSTNTSILESLSAQANKGRYRAIEMIVQAFKSDL